MCNIIDQIAVYTRLCKVYSDLPLNADTTEEYEPIERRRQELKAQIATTKVEIDRLKKG